MEKSYKMSFILLTFFIVLGLMNIVSAESNISYVDLDDSSLSSVMEDNVHVVNNNLNSKKIHVSCSGDDESGDGSENSPYASLSKAINESDSGSIICLGDGVYTGENNRNLLINKDLIISSSGAVIDAESKGRIFTILENCSFCINSLSFIRGNASTLDNLGGVIYSEGNLTINNCEFNDSYANDGSVIYSKSDLSVNGSVFNNNRAWASGGAIYNSGDNGFINNSIFYQNHAMSSTTEVYGGAIYNSGRNFTIYNSTFESNYARELNKLKNGPSCGGAIYNLGKDLLISHCNFFNNYVEIRTDAGKSEVCLNVSYGGAIYSVPGGQVEHSSFVNNTAHCRYSNNQVNLYGNRCQGGAIYLDSGDGFYILNCTFINCSSAYGALSNHANNVIFENNTFDNSKSMFRGSAVYDTGDYSIYLGNHFLNHNDPKNTAQGTVYISSKYVTFINNTFSNNYDVSGSVHSTNNAAIYIENSGFYTEEETDIKIYGNTFDGNDKAVYLYGACGAEILNNTFNNQLHSAIDTYVGKNIAIGNNYFSNNHGYRGAIDLNSYNSIIYNNTFENNSATEGGGIAILCRENVTIGNNTFINNNATRGGDIYSLYGAINVVGNNFTNGSAKNGSSIYAEVGDIRASDNTFTVYYEANLNIIYQTHMSTENYKDNIIYDSTPQNKDGTSNKHDLNDFVSNHKKTKDDFDIISKPGEYNADLNDDDSKDDSNSHTDKPISDIINDIINDIQDIVNEITNRSDSNGEGSSDGFNGSSIESGGDSNSRGSSNSNSSDVGMSNDILSVSSSSSDEPAPAESVSSNSQNPSSASAYTVNPKKEGVSDKSINNYVILLVIMLILLIYGYYRGKKEF